MLVSKLDEKGINKGLIRRPFLAADITEMAATAIAWMFGCRFTYAAIYDIA